MTQSEGFRTGNADAEVDARQKLTGRGGLCQSRQPPASRVLALPGYAKKEAGHEGTGLPGVVSVDIVNWEGNYILDTNTFLIDTTTA